MGSRFLLTAFACSLLAVASAQPEVVAPQPSPTITPEEAARRKNYVEWIAARDKLLEEESAAARSRIAAVAADPRAFPAWIQEWAGEYSCGDGLGMNVSILIGPTGKVVYTWHGCMGLYDSQIAPIREVKSDRLVLDLESLGDEHKGMNYLDSELLLVRWGPRHYVIPSKKLQDFCNHVNDGWEARNPGGFYPIQNRGPRTWPKNPASAPSVPPEVPAEARGWLLAAPVDAPLVRIESLQAHPSSQPTLMDYTATVTLGAGSAKGLRNGMQLTWKGPSVSAVTVKLADVRENESIGDLRMMLYSKTQEFSTDFLKPGLIFRTGDRAKEGT